MRKDASTRSLVERRPPYMFPELRHPIISEAGHRLTKMPASPPAASLHAHQMLYGSGSPDDAGADRPPHGIAPTSFAGLAFADKRFNVFAPVRPTEAKVVQLAAVLFIVEKMTLAQALAVRYTLEALAMRSDIQHTLVESVADVFHGGLAQPNAQVGSPTTPSPSPANRPISVLTAEQV
ncbi:ANTAR domain-containing protein [Plasmodiophora brassicae]